MLSVIVARARGGAIGQEGVIPWHAPEDLSFFQRETLGGAVIMGRRTWDSLPRRPLPRRYNLVVTSRPEGVEGAQPVGLGEALYAARAAGYLRVYAIGGAAIYGAFLPVADRMLITEVDLDVPGADTHFPEFDAGLWRLNSCMVVRNSGPRCVVNEYLRPLAVPGVEP